MIAITASSTADLLVAHLAQLTHIVYYAECQPASTTWQAGGDRSNAFLQSWQVATDTLPASNSMDTTNEPFQRAAEIVAAAATEAAAAAASVVVSAASKKIKEQLESLYSSQASAPGSCGNLTALPEQLVRPSRTSPTAFCGFEA